MHTYNNSENYIALSPHNTYINQVLALLLDTTAAVTVEAVLESHQIVSVMLTVSFLVTAAVMQTAPRPVSNDVNKNFTNCIYFSNCMVCVYA